MRLWATMTSALFLAATPWTDARAGDKPAGTVYEVRFMPGGSATANLSLREQKKPDHDLWLVLDGDGTWEFDGKKVKGADVLGLVASSGRTVKFEALSDPTKYYGSIVSGRFTTVREPGAAPLQKTYPPGKGPNTPPAPPTPAPRTEPRPGPAPAPNPGGLPDVIRFPDGVYRRGPDNIYRRETPWTPPSPFSPHSPGPIRSPIVNSPWPGYPSAPGCPPCPGGGFTPYR